VDVLRYHRFGTHLFAVPTKTKLGDQGKIIGEAVVMACAVALAYPLA
jgi:hypothetical protein